MSSKSGSVLERPEREQKKLVAKESPRTLSLLQEPEKYSRRRSFAVGFFFQIIFLVVLIRVGAYTPKLVQEKPHEVVELVAPRLDETPPPPPRLIAPKLSKPVTPQLPKPTPPQVQPPVEPPPVQARIEPPKALSTPQPPVPVRHIEVTKFAVPPTTQPPAPPKAEVKTHVFAGSSAQPTIKAPVQQVQTGGFGNPVGAKGSTTETAKLNAPKLGGFDMPSGPGNGNGTGGAHGRPGVVASAGFGSGVAANGTRDVPGGGIHSGGFGEYRTTSAETSGPAKTAAPAMTPVQILEKPQPVYSKEARDLKIEGEVHLKVLFQADGTVRVLQVVQGLGHGLDQAATTAAEKIRFKPAQRDGRPCDMTATVHILFQLAS